MIAWHTITSMTTLKPLIAQHSLLGSTTRIPFTIFPSVMHMWQVGKMTSHWSYVKNAQFITNTERLARMASLNNPPPRKKSTVKKKKPGILILKVWTRVLLKWKIALAIGSWNHPELKNTSFIKSRPMDGLHGRVN